ncbi:MAG: DEAD/DEAH box helicase [Leadbetterella sp.]
MNESSEFSSFNITKQLQNALDDLGFTHPIGIQKEVFNPIMAGKDVFGLSQTGSGKTLAYLLPSIRMWSFSKDKLPQILVLVPTLEMVNQVAQVARSLAKYLSFDVQEIHGGVNPKVHIKQLQNGCDMVIATTGRCLDLIQAGIIKTKNIKKVILDEYDIMLDMGFRPQIEQIFHKLPEKKQHLFFSATFGEDMTEFLDDYLKDHVLIESNQGTIPSGIQQFHYLLPNFSSKINLLDLLITNDPSLQKILIFASKKEWADIIFNTLKSRGFQDLEILHGNKSYNTRTSTLAKFKSGESKILICSDIASRGLDIADISHVINMDVPSPDEDYIHRIGRTGRNNQSGSVYNLIAESELPVWNSLQENLGIHSLQKTTPEFLELSDLLYGFEIEREKIKKTYKTSIKNDSGAFHEKLDKNKKVNVRRNIEKEKQKKYGKQYRKE